LAAVEDRVIENQPESGPVIVGVDGWERYVEALALADLLGRTSVSCSPSENRLDSFP
jgi:hypothetical protein